MALLRTDVQGLLKVVMQTLLKTGTLATTRTGVPNAAARSCSSIAASTVTIRSFSSSPERCRCLRIRLNADFHRCTS